MLQFSSLQFTNNMMQGGQSNIQRNDSPSQSSLVANAPYGGVEIIKSNVLRDPGFEEDDGSGGPSEFSGYGTASVIIDSAYTTEVYAGSYGAYMRVEGTEQYSEYATNDRYLPSIPERSYMNELIDLDFWYNCKANPDLSTTGQVYLYFQIMSDIGNIYMYYFLSANTVPGANTTYYGYYDVRGSLDSWININRNFTHDFISAFPTRVLSQSYIRTIYFTCSSPEEPTGAIELLVDEVSITNDTSFDYLADNGDFEDGDSYPWDTQRSDPGSIYVTKDDYSLGTQSMNITSYSPTTSAYCDASADLNLYSDWNSIPKGYFAQQLDDIVIEFDWKYSDTLAGEEFAYVYILLANTTFSCGFFYFLGSNNDDIPSGYLNYTQPTYINNFRLADDFDVRDTWNHFSIDIYNEMQLFSLVNLATYYIGFTTRADGPNSKVQLLVDECKVITYPTGDPSFENSFIWLDTNPITAWTTPNNDDHVNITSDAFSGNYAANLTSHSGNTNVYCRRDMHLPVENNLFTDFMWRLDELTDISQWAYAQIRLILDDNHVINYMIGKNSPVAFTNDSNDCYYDAEGINQIGVWNNLFRNISDDAYAAFGVDNWNITQIDLKCYAGNPDVASAIFDDLHFVRDNTGPTITNPAINPLAPEYGETVDVTVDVFDSTEILQVELIHKIGTGSWDSDIMTPSYDEYSATIPSADYGVTIEYYFIAEDVYGNFAQLGSSGSPYSYVVDDTVNPVLVVEAPSEANNLTGIVRFNITEAYDLGSDIAAFEIIINSIVEYSSAIVPAYYEWNTTSIHNTDILVVFRLEDNAGNDVQIILLYTLNNPTPTPSPTDTGSFIGGFLSVSFVLMTSIFIVTRVRRKKKV